MNDDTGKRTIFEVFADVKREVAPVGKDSENKQQHFKYRGVDAVVNAAADALDKHGVITAPLLQSIEYGTVQVGQARTVMGHVKVQVIYRFYGPAGDHFDAHVPGEAMDSGDKATPKAMSVAYRIALIQALNLPTGDPAPDSQTYERSPASGAGSAFDNATPAPPRNGQRRQQQEPPVPAKLEPGDPWATVIDDIHTAEEADAAEAELRRSFQAREITAERATQVKHWLRVKAAPMRTAAQSPPPGRESTTEPAGETAPADDGQADPGNSWFADFLTRIHTTPSEGLNGLRPLIGRAVAERQITPEQGSMLSAELVKRRRDLEEQPAQAEDKAA